MRIHFALLFSILLLGMFSGAIHGQTQTVVIKGPVIGTVLWWQANNVMDAGGNFMAKKAEFSAQIADARSKYFGCYPNCPDIKNLERNFSEVLWEKDLYLMYLLYVGGPGPLLERATGLVDGGLQKYCAEEFGKWEAGVEFYSGHLTGIQGVAAPFDAAKFVRALDQVKDEYQKYQTCRDSEEFRLHARPPYNNIALPASARIETDPDKIGVMGRISQEQLIHVTLLEPITSPVRNSTAALAGGESKVRARLENTLVANAQGETGTAVFIQAGVSVSITVKIAQADALGTDSSVSMQIMDADLGGNRHQQLISENVAHRYSGWPPPGTVLVPANTPLSFRIQCGCVRPYSKAEFQASAAAAAPKTDARYGSLPILMNSRLPVQLLETIDATNVESGRLFRGQLSGDMELPQGLPETGAVKVLRGTEAYLKVVVRDPGGPLSKIADLSLAQVVLNGQKVPLRTVPIMQSFGLPAVVAGGERNTRPAAPQVIWSVNSTNIFTTREQQDVPDSGPPFFIGSDPKEPEPKVGTPATVAPAATPAPVPASAAGQGGAPGDRQQQLESIQQQAQKTAACQQQALKDHPQGGTALTQALTECARP